MVQNESSSDETASQDSAESFTRLYSARGFSPTSEKSESGNSSTHEIASNSNWPCVTKTSSLKSIVAYHKYRYTGTFV